MNDLPLISVGGIISFVIEKSSRKGCLDPGSKLQPWLSRKNLNKKNQFLARYPPFLYINKIYIYSFFRSLKCLSTVMRLFRTLKKFPNIIKLSKPIV